MTNDDPWTIMCKILQGFATAATGRECPPVTSGNVHRVADEVLGAIAKAQAELAAVDTAISDRGVPERDCRLPLAQRVNNILSELKEWRSEAGDALMKLEKAEAERDEAREHLAGHTMDTAVRYGRAAIAKAQAERDAEKQRADGEHENFGLLSLRCAAAERKVDSLLAELDAEKQRADELVVLTPTFRHELVAREEAWPRRRAPRGRVMDTQSKPRIEAAIDEFGAAVVRADGHVMRTRQVAIDLFAKMEAQLAAVTAQRDELLRVALDVWQRGCCMAAAIRCVDGNDDQRMAKRWNAAAAFDAVDVTAIANAERAQAEQPIHLSDELFEGETACSKPLASDVKRTQSLASVSCPDCQAIALMAEEAAQEWVMNQFQDGWETT